jgi:hypothetical protein
MSKLTFTGRDAWLAEKTFAGKSLKRLGDWNSIAAFSRAVHALMDGTPPGELGDQTARLFVQAYKSPDSKAFLTARLGEIQDTFRRKAAKKGRPTTTLTAFVSNHLGYVVLWTDDAHEFVAWRWWLNEEDRRQFELGLTLGVTS